MYFVTICTKNRQHFFGDIPSESEKDSIILNPTEIGKIAHSEWYKTIDLRPDMNLELGEFVVMPNHIHGIVIIGQNKYNTNNGRDALPCVSTNKNQFGPLSKNLASIIRGYKTAVTKYARLNNINFD